MLMIKQKIIDKIPARMTRRTKIFYAPPSTYAEFMVEESLRLIFEAERKARDRLEAAKREAAEILDSTKREIERFKLSAETERKKKAQDAFERSKREAEADLEEMLKRTRKQIQAMERKAKARAGEAIKLVQEVILK